MTIEDLKEVLKDYDWTQNGIEWKKDGRVFTLNDCGLVYYQGGISMAVDRGCIGLVYGKDVLEINLEHESVEVGL